MPNPKFKIGDRVRTNDTIIQKREYGGIEGVVVWYDTKNSVVEVTNEGTACYPKGSRINLYLSKYDLLETDVPTIETYSID